MYDRGTGTELPCFSPFNAQASLYSSELLQLRIQFVFPGGVGCISKLCSKGVNLRDNFLDELVALFQLNARKAVPSFHLVNPPTVQNRFTNEPVS